MYELSLDTLGNVVGPPPIVELVRRNGWPVWLTLPKIRPTMPSDEPAPPKDCGCGGLA